MPQRRVPCVVEEESLETDDGRLVEGVRATCTRCEQTSESYGTSVVSVRRCLAELRRTCPLGEGNYYVRVQDSQAQKGSP